LAPHAVDLVDRLAILVHDEYSRYGCFFGPHHVISILRPHGGFRRSAHLFHVLGGIMHGERMKHLFVVPHGTLGPYLRDIV
jgi:hypothetical protein